MSRAYFGIAIIVSAEDERTFECVNVHSIKRPQARATPGTRSNRISSAACFVPALKDISIR